MQEPPRTAQPEGMLAIIRWALMAGAAGGAFSALGEFGATWLWLPVWRDRLGLLVRLLATEVPLGAALAALFTAAMVGSFAFAERRLTTRARAAACLFWTVCATPLLRLLAVKLCSGGMMSRLKGHDLIAWLLTLGLIAALFVALRAGTRVHAFLRANEQSAPRVALVLLGASFAVAKINQTFLPNLYEYLHALGTLVSFALAACAFGIAGGHYPWARVAAREQKEEARAGAALAGATLPSVRDVLSRPRLSLALAAALTLALALNVLTLDQNLNVRVALFDARAPTSRALLTAANPLLQKLERDQRTRAIKPLPQRQRTNTQGLARYEGAHVLLVTIDALRADHLGAYGYARPVSPELDQLARSAWQFRRAYAQAPHSSYSLSSLHASDYLHELVELGRPLPEATLASVLRDHGYHTAAFFTDGIFHTEGHKLARYRDSAFGFALFDQTNREAEDQTDRVLAEVERIREQGEPPSLFWVHYFDVHEPYQETTFGSSDLDRYDSEIKHVDRELARLLKELEKRLSRPLVLAISADHGEEFREHGGVYHGSTLFDEQVHVPLVLRAPGQEAHVIDAPVEVIDIAPTLLGLVGVEPPTSMRGRDLRALASGQSQDDKPVFSAVLTKRMALRWPHKLIADLRFGLFELYDLERDPSERNNLAQAQPEQLALLRADIYGWLDSLEVERGASAETSESARTRALRWGRLGDRRAVAPMGELLLDTHAARAERIEAGQILAKLADESSAPALVAGLETEPPEVAAEAAIALGRMYDERARGALERLVDTEDPYLRARAAVSLGRLRDVRAVPALIDALWVAPTLYEREEAVRWLGRLRDARAVEPLLSLIPEFGLRYLVAVALGEIGDARAYDALTDMLSWEERTNIRDEIVRGLGLLGDARAIDVLLATLRAEPELKQTAESLVRLGALARGKLAGRDIEPSLAGKGGLFACVAGPLHHDWDYLQRTTCHARTGARVGLPLAQLKTELARGAMLIVRLRRADAPDKTELAFALDGHALAARDVDANWVELRFALEPAWLHTPQATLQLHATNAEASFQLDHALVLPELDAGSLATSGAVKATHHAHTLD
jgi:arylsulfatase A-like enzyme/HEAT repeat protein